VCEGLLIKACRGGTVSEQIGDCTLERGCRGGRCMSAPCAADTGTDRNGFTGCLFYSAEADNVASDAAAAMSFLVTNPGVESASVAWQQPGAGGTWISTAQATVPAGKSARLSLASLQVVEAGVRVGRALRVTSTRPVTVAQIQNDDGNEMASSSGGTMLLPVQALGYHYRVMTYRQTGTAALGAIEGSAGGAGRLLVVGTEAGTNVKFTASANASAVVAGSLPTVAPGGSIDFVLGDGDVFQAWSGADGDDLAGSEVKADRPVAVFSGNIATAYGKTAAGIHSPDMAHEQMPPIASWSLVWVAASLPPQAATCDTLLGQPGASLWRLLAANDGTRVDFLGPAGGAPLPGTLTLNEGEVFELTTVGDFVVSASGPLLMTQGIDCEPTLALAISGDKPLQDLTFAVLPSFDHMVAVARMQGAPVLYDDARVADGLFTPAGGGFEVARIPVSGCSASQQICTHRLSGQFGMTVRGMDVLASYGLTAPAWKGCVDPSDPNCVL
jgi:hypothetical protein